MKGKEELQDTNGPEVEAQGSWAVAESKMFYFGPWDRPGHFLVGEHGSHVPYKNECPWTPDQIDGILQPKDSQAEGRALLHYKDGWTALSFHDRSVDTRGGCNSTYFARGVLTFDEIVLMAKTRFAERWERMKFEVTQATDLASNVQAVSKPTDSSTASPRQRSE